MTQRTTAGVILISLLASEIHFIQMSPKSVYPLIQYVLDDFNIPGSRITVNKDTLSGHFPGGPVVRTPCSHCQGPKFNLWSGN